MSDIQCKIVKTPNPNEIGLAVYVRDTLLASHPELFPPTSGNLRYDQFDASALKNGLVSLDQSYVTGFGSYVYTYYETGSWGNESADGIPTTVLFFSKAKTDKERNTPFKTFYTKRDWTWPGILYGIVVLTYTDPISGKTKYIPRYFEQERYVGPTLFKIEQFLSEVPWNANTFHSTAPQPGTVDALIVGPDGTLPIHRSGVLHPTLHIVNPFPLDTNLFFHTGEVPAFNTNNTVFTFAATSPSGWINYVADDGQNPVQGQYLRERVTAYPPRITTIAPQS